MEAAGYLNVTVDSVAKGWWERKKYQFCPRSLPGAYLKSLRLELKTNKQKTNKSRCKTPDPGSRSLSPNSIEILR